MAYRVEVTKGAEADLEDLYRWVVQRAPTRGAAWFNGLETAIRSLDRFPERCPVAAESFDSDHPVRVRHYGRAPHTYRVLFAIDEAGRTVYVLHIRRGVRRPLDPNDLVQ